MKYQSFAGTVASIVIVAICIIAFALLTRQDRKINSQIPFWSWAKQWFIDDMFTCGHQRQAFKNYTNGINNK